jgi:hypothetical protein
MLGAMLESRECVFELVRKLTKSLFGRVPVPESSERRATSATALQALFSGEQRRLKQENCLCRLFTLPASPLPCTTKTHHRRSSRFEVTMTQVDSAETAPDDYEDMPGGPGAPIPISQLVVSSISHIRHKQAAHICQGLSGLTDRDIKLVVEGGFHTVESIAYTYAQSPSISSSRVQPTNGGP